MMAEDGELRVSTLELFFDLVFVFTVTQLTTLIEHDLSAVGAVRAALIFVIMYWMYGGYAWLTNQLPPEPHAHRLLLIGGMAAFLVCALAIPHAFEDDALAFAIGYLLVVLVHAGLYGHGYGRAVWRFVPMNVLGAFSLVGAAFVHGASRYAFWALPILLQYLTSRLAGQVDESRHAGFDLRPAHFVERHGLLLIVVFGESIVAIGIGLGELALNPTIYGAAVLGLVLAAVLWWSHFVEDQDRAEEALTGAPVGDRVRMALGGFFYAYMPILFGVVALAAGLRHAIGHITEPLPLAHAVLLGGGVGLFLAGEVAFRRALGIAPLLGRTVAAATAFATPLAGVHASALAQVAILIALVAAALVVEAPARWAAVPRG